MNQKKTSYKLLSIDLDGTLLSPFLRKAKKVDCLAIQEYMSAGGTAFINTGRAPWAIVKTINRINKMGPNRIRLLSCWNGSYILDFNDSTVKQAKISHVYAKQIFDIAKKYKGAYTWFFTDAGMKTRTVYVYPQNHLIKLVYRNAHLKKLTNSDDLSSFKINVLSSSKSTVAKIYHDLVKNNLNHIVNLSHSSSRLIEITPKGINKGYAIDYYAKKYNISKNEVVSLGDSFNDLSAFKNSALSIGINPRNPNLLEHCDALINHKTRGVSEAIKTYIIKDTSELKFKLIFADLDGTLIDPKTKIFSNETKIALQQCSNHLIPIAIASGRSIYDGVRIAKQMELNPKTNVYIIGNNGATIFDIYTNKYISQTPLDDADARKIFSMMKDFAKKENGNLGFMIHQHSEDILFYNEEFWKPINFKKTGFEDQYDPWAIRKPTYITEYPNDIICYKYIIKFPNHKRALEGNEELRKTFPNLEICLSSDVNVEINKKGVNKGFAAKKLLEKIQVTPDNILVLGDGQNDIPALKMTNHSFVPSYAPDFVKKEAKHVIDNVSVTNFASTVIDEYVLKRNR